MAEQQTYGDGETAEEVIETLNEILDEVQRSHSKMSFQLSRIKAVIFQKDLTEDRYGSVLKEIIKIVNE